MILKYSAISCPTLSKKKFTLYMSPEPDFEYLLLFCVLYVYVVVQIAENRQMIVPEMKITSFR